MSRTRKVYCLLSLTILLLTGCAGYAFRKQSNPLDHYGIKAISVPNFYNRSQLPRASTILTSKFIEMFSGFKGLTVYTGENEKADAYLIGIVRSANEKFQTFKADGVQLASSVAKDNIGAREDFLVPSSTSVFASVELYLVRNSNYSQVQYLLNKTSTPFENIEVVFARQFPLSFKFQRVLLNGEAQAVNQTQSMGSYDQSLRTTAEGLADSFRYEMLLTF
jgi:hypothetical protein